MGGILGSMLFIFLDLTPNLAMYTTNDFLFNFKWVAAVCTEYFFFIECRCESKRIIKYLIFTQKFQYNSNACNAC